MADPVTPDPRALLDALDEAHAKATPGPWSIRDDGVTVEIEGADRDSVRDRDGFSDADAAAVVAAHNALPALTAAVRAALDLADEYERRGRINADPTSLDSRVHQMAADRLRSTVTAALTGGQA